MGSGSSQQIQLPPRDRAQHQKSLLLGFLAFRDICNSLPSSAKLGLFYLNILAVSLVGWSVDIVCCLLFYSLARTFIITIFINDEGIGRDINHELYFMLALVALTVTRTDRRYSSSF